MEKLNDLTAKWHEIVFTYEKEADRAWRSVDVESTDIAGEIKYMQELIKTAENYINNK